MENPKNLSPAVVKILKNSNHRIWVSMASLWELAIKSSLGKLQMPSVALESMEAELAAVNFGSLPINARHIAETTRLPWIHRDLFDRMLIAQARVENLTLVTVDRHITQYAVKTLFAR